MVNEDGLEERIGKLDQRIGELEERKGSRVATVFSVLAFVISVLALLIFDIPERLSAPAVELVMPREARLAQIPYQTENGGWEVRVWLQPTFVNTGRSQRVEVLKSVNVFVKQAGEQQCKKFWLDGIGSFKSDPERNSLTFTYERGASPLVVTQDTPQDHVLAFELREDAEHPHADDPYFVGKHHYLMTLVAETATKPQTLLSTIGVSADQATLEKRADTFLKGQSQSPKVVSNKWVSSGAPPAETPTNWLKENCPLELDERATQPPLPMPPSP